MLKSKIQNDLKEAMKASKKDVVEVLRSTITAITVKEKEKGTGDLSDAEVTQVITKQIKDRKNSIQMFTDGNRPDLVEKEQNQIDILAPYVPAGLSDAEVEAIIKDIIVSNSYGKSDMGKVMGAWNAKYKGQADGKLVSDIVKANL